MKRIAALALAIFGTQMTPTTGLAADAAKEGTCYEMRVYYSPPGKLDELHARFKNHTMALFEKHGMTNVGYWVPVDNKENKLVYILSYPSREARNASWKAFMADPAWQSAWKASEKNGTLVSKVEEIFMGTTDYSPAPTAGKRAAASLWELRTYHTPEGKLPNLNARFRDHTVNLFAKHGMRNFGYWVKTPGQKGADTTLIYLISHKDKAARDASFDAFRQDPEWIKARAESEKGGSLTLKEGGVLSELLTPTDYSPTN